MAEVKQIKIEAEVEESSDNSSTDNKDGKEKTLVTRMREIAEVALDTIKSEVKQEIEERISPVEETATNLTAQVKEEVEAIVQRVRDQYETEREELLQAEIDKEVETAVQAVHEEYKAERDRLLRTAAEAENTKKRLQTDYQRQLKFANEGILEGMVPVLDSLEAAIKSVTERVEESTVSPAFTTFNEGVQLVHKQLLDALKTHGLAPIVAVGETFDPNQHEALLVTPSDDVPDGKVIEEFRRGYMLHTRVLRASQVVVSQGPAKVEETSSDTADDTDETDAAE
ncbi:nucleotide exchange factor GrpE [Candidatus Poribacteria bacterium]|nr:nucleotide exchange factor GrpE [Candidatus Poribacteria bacterium]MYH83805.1 nucleotide exchange factor GrpE [Candidatus Poribacteria bacterium]MYK93915.1 nucleotide exchange factor GrpE [Candidatus Poribacteria bacterium]